jgi:hypothetical protein
MTKAERTEARIKGGRKGGKLRAKARGAISLKNIGKLGGTARAANHTEAELAEIAKKAWITRRRNARQAAGA